MEFAPVQTEGNGERIRWMAALKTIFKTRDERYEKIMKFKF